MVSLDREHLLRRVAEQATGGDWAVSKDINDQCVIYSGDEWIALLPHQCVTSIERQREKDAVFIATCSPAAVLKLLDALAAMRPVVEAAVAYGMAPSGCSRSEARLVDAAGRYEAQRRIDAGKRKDGGS